MTEGEPSKASFEEHELLTRMYENSRGSKFLKAWMQHLEDHADLRYPNLADVYADQAQ